MTGTAITAGPPSSTRMATSPFRDVVERTLISVMVLTGQIYGRTSAVSGKRGRDLGPVPGAIPERVSAQCRDRLVQQRRMQFGEHAGEQIWVYNAAIFFVPWCVIAAILAFIYLRDVPVKANIKQQLDIFSNPNTWYMTILYVMTFGLFSGFSAVFGLLINNQFGRASSIGLPVLGATFAFLGPLIGSIIRMSWGVFCDRMGGAIWTFISGVGMAVTLGGIAWVLYNPKGWSDFYIFMALMLAMFLFSGFGNAGTFKQMPMIMPARQAGGAIGFTSAIASLGPFLVGAALSAVGAKGAWTFFVGCAIFCALCSVLCWIMYARKNAPFPG